MNTSVAVVAAVCCPTSGAAVPADGQSVALQARAAVRHLQSVMGQHSSTRHMYKAQSMQVLSPAASSMHRAIGPTLHLPFYAGMTTPWWCDVVVSSALMVSLVHSYSSKHTYMQKCLSLRYFSHRKFPRQHILHVACMNSSGLLTVSRHGHTACWTC